MTDYKSPLPVNQGSTKLSEISVDTSAPLLGASAHDSALRVTEQILKVTSDILRRQNYFLRSSGLITWNTLNTIELGTSDIYLDILQTENAGQPLISLKIQASDFPTISVADGEIVYLELDPDLIKTLGSTIVIENGLSGGGTPGKRIRRSTTMPTIISPIDGTSITTTYCLPIIYAKGVTAHWIPHGIAWPAGTTSRLGAVIVEGQEPYQDYSVNDYPSLASAISNLALTGGVILLTDMINIVTGTTIEVPENIKIIGRGPKTGLTLNGTAKVKIGKNVTLQDFKIVTAADFVGNAIHMDANSLTVPCQKAIMSNITLDLSASIDQPLLNTWTNNAVEGSKLNNAVMSIAVQSDGKAILGGLFTNYAGTSGRNYVVRLNADGTVDEDFCIIAVDGSKFNSYPLSIAFDSSNNIYIGGGFTNYAGTTNRNYLIKLNSSGVLDTTFCTNAVDGAKFNSSINAIAIDPSNNIYIGGGFTNYINTNRNYLLKLNSAGVVDTTFVIAAVDGAKFNNIINALIIDSSNNIYVGGRFTNYAGTTNRNRLVKFSSAGVLDTTFCTNAVDGAKISSDVNALSLDSSNNIYVGGAFTSYNGTANRNYLIKLNSSGVLDTTFCTNAVDGKFTGTINSIKTDTSNNVFVGGAFQFYPGGTSRSRLVKFSSIGVVDSAFCTTAVDGYINQPINAMVIRNNRLFFGGYFTAYLTLAGRNYATQINATSGVLDGAQSAVNVTGVRIEANNCRVLNCWFKGVAAALQRTGINYVDGYSDNTDIDNLFE